MLSSEKSISEHQDQCSKHKVDRIEEDTLHCTYIGTDIPSYMYTHTHTLKKKEIQNFFLDLVFKFKDPRD